MSKSLEDWVKGTARRPKDPTKKTTEEGIFNYIFGKGTKKGATVTKQKQAAKKKAVRKKKAKKRKSGFSYGGTLNLPSTPKKSAQKQTPSNVAPTSFECSVCSAILMSPFRDIFSSMDDPVACSKCGQMCVAKYCNHFTSNKWCNSSCYQKK